MQPYVFPYLGYYQLIKAVDKFVMYDDVNFITRGWVNRNNILVNNKAHLFTIPLKDSSQNRPIRDISVAVDRSWTKKILKTLEHSYKKAPFFEETLSLINNVFDSSLTHIHQISKRSIFIISRYLDLDSEFVDSSSSYNNYQLKGQERILDICRREGADQYVNPIGGQEIYSNVLFENSGIKLNFIKSNAIMYKQFVSEFVPNLSIIDALMFNSKEEVKEMLDEYELI